MKIRIRNIALIFTLLLLGGVTNGAWAKVTYHILSLPMTTYQRDGTNNLEGNNIGVFRSNVRVEVLRVVSTDLHVNLPFEYRSPLATNYRYYSANYIAQTGPNQLYGYNNTKYYFYNIKDNTDTNTTNNADYGDSGDKVGGDDDNKDDNVPLTAAVEAGVRLTPGAVCDDNIHIYVTYDVKASPDIDLSTTLNTTTGLLSAGKKYNIHLKDRMVVLNQNRQNRPGAVLDNFYTPEQLSSDDFSWIEKGGLNNTAGYRHFTFKFGGNDPYNVTIYTAYDKPTTFRGTGQADFFTKDVKEKDKYSQKDVYKEYRGASFFRLMSDAEMNDKNMWLSSDADIQWLEGGSRDNAVRKVVPGYYKGPNDTKSTLYEMSPIFNSFAILNHKSGTGYAFAGSKMNEGTNNRQPRSSDGYIQFMDYGASGNNITIVFKAEASVMKVDIYEVKDYVFRIKTPFGNVIEVEKDWSEFYKTENVLNHIPDALKRKYVSFTKAYTSDDPSTRTEITTFEDADANGGVIWLDYTTSMPFETVPKNALGNYSYTDARWYTIRMNGATETQNLGYYSSGSFYTGLGSNSDSELHQGENSSEAQFAFMGDPFELKILSRAACEAAGANRFVGCPSDADASLTPTLTAQTGSSDISTWQIEPGSIATPDYMILRQYNTEGKYIGWNDGIANKPMCYSTTSSSIRVVELEKKNYVYHIVRSDGSIAVKASEEQDVGKPLSYNSIPDIIRSIGIANATLSFYWTKENATAGTNAKTHAQYTPTSEGNDIYVRYSFEGDPLGGAINGVAYFVQLNGEYIYYDNGTIKSVTKEDFPLTDNSPYQWTLGGNDPYAMTIMNNDAAKYVMIADGDGDDEPDWATGNITWSTVVPTSKFIVKLNTTDPSITNVYEVMAATGDAVDASSTYYHIARPERNLVKVVSNSTSTHNSPTLRFELDLKDAPTHRVTYHLIDKSGIDLLQTSALHEESAQPKFPTDYYSSLVADYHYYVSMNFTTSTVNGKTIYSLNGTPSELATIGDVTDVYVTYTTGTSVDLTNKKTMYLLKYTIGEEFRQENGTDDLLAPLSVFTGSESERKNRYQAVYPYCNGDGNFFVYGEEQFDIQQQGAASTRTRWAWFLESDNNDPYHVKICSRQTETYNDDDIRGYFATYQPDDYNEIVTGLVWPNISGIQGTEYMILGSKGSFRLVTTNTIPLDVDHNGTPESNERKTVTSFEQYWKTYDTIKNKLLKKAGILLPEDEGANPNGSILVPTDPASYRALLTGTGEGQFGFHSYSKWSLAKRFNGYNREGKTSKGWEELEHWFQTIEMGEGMFDLVSIDINPVLILLDQHGWEIMRKPLPTDPNDPTKAAKYDAIRPYDSPMVKAYYFWTKASKRSGFHQYYNLSQQVMVDGEPYTSTSLTSLPPYNTATNLHDSKGNHLDEYVTYIVKDEYAQCYDPSTKTGEPFLIQQGEKYASYNGSTLSKENVPNPGGMSQYIINNSSELTLSGDKKNDLWYVKPNTEIDKEMGYTDALVTWSDNPYDKYNPTSRTASLITDDNNKALYGGFSFSNGFDPYNIQISSAVHSKYFVSNATGASIEEGQGSIIGSYGADPVVTMGDQQSISGTWYDSRQLKITNSTFMVVQDADGNMQLMPRFDQLRRMKNFSSLTSPDDPEIIQTHTQIFRPLVYNYHIIDNAGNESLRYNSGGDLVPQTPDHFKSPLAKDFKYYRSTTFTDENEIDESFASEGMVSSSNEVYVRYAYDEESDANNILKGKWLTMQLNGKDVQYTTVSETAGIYADNEETPTMPATINATAKIWQWKFLKTPQSTPDPYAVQLFNRNNPGANNELPSVGKYFALLPHSSGGYALAEARTANTNYDTYNFLNGDGLMSSSNAAAIAREANFLSTSCDFNGTNSNVILDDDKVEYNFTYTILTNSNVRAISAEQDNSTIYSNDYEPVLPETIISPLLNIDQYRYYEDDVALADTAGLALQKLYGLYDDQVYVHYTAYDPLTTGYKVPNERNATGTGQVERANTSNDASIDINDELLYNIIWFGDKMMTGTDGNAITDGGSRELGGSPSGQVWYLAGNDPYAIKLRTVVGDTPANRYVHKVADAATCDLTANDGEATTFMLLPREDNYEYGMLQITGGTGKMTGFGSTLTTDDAVPYKFIIFALSTHKVTYHLVISNIGSAGATIPYFEVNNEYPDGHLINKTFQGTTQRNLTNNRISDHEVGHISLGDPLKVPTDMIRPNVDYFFYVDDIYDVKNDGTDGSLNETLTNLYKGHLVKAMAADSRLVGKHVKINIVYTFQGGLATNAGDGFVTEVSQNKWYTFKSLKDDGTPRLMQFTNAWGMEVKDGEGTHYTNDYLWTPIGDPYGFKMYHRYTLVNSGAWNNGEPNRVMTTIDKTASGGTGPLVEGKDVTMSSDMVSLPDTEAPYCVYELLADEETTPGYFKIHPVANTGEPKYYFRIVKDKESPSSSVYHDYVRLSALEHSEFTFGLSEDMVKPYYDRAGYVGGLTPSAKTAYKAVDSDPQYKTPAERLIAKQLIVYNPQNIVSYIPGYYRLHSPEDISGIATRYASGYTHKKELVGGENAPLPMHFYERKGINTTFEILGSGFTFSESTRGALPISAPEYDPASIFRFYKVPWDTPQGNPEGVYKNYDNIAILSTQGLYLKGSKEPGNTEGVDERAKVVMTDIESEATPLFIMDIGGGILLIHDQQTADRRANLKYLSFDQNESIYDLKLTHNTHTDHAKWLMEPVNAQGLRLNVNSGGDAGEYGTTYYYTTFYAPFDILLPEDDTSVTPHKLYTAYVCQEGFSPWPGDNGELHPKPIGEFNTGGYQGNDQFVPAGTPVLIATTDNAGSIKATIPTNSPSTPLASIFTGQYLEQKLDAGNDVFVFGLPFTSELEMDKESGDITGTLPQKAATGAGFYLNANQNKELGLSKASWTRNNWYVLGNKIYYRASASPARKNTRGIEFVPVIFDDEELEDPDIQDANDGRVGDGCVYDLLGRKVATKQQVEEGTWRQNLRPGIYILNGRKIRL